MTDTQDDQTPSKDEIADYWTERHSYQPDSVLAALVGTAAKQGGGTGITLLVGGALVTGDLANRIEWLDGLREAHPDDTIYMEGVRAAWAEVHAKYAADSDDDPMPEYDAMIHLINARVFQGSKLIPDGEQAMFWRGRLSEVQGWSLGTLAPATS